MATHQLPLSSIPRQRVAGRFWLIRSVLIAAGVLGLANGVSAATLYWDGTDTTTNADGGSGTWDTTLTNTNWDSLATGGTPTSWVNTANNDADFRGTAGTVTLATGISAKSLTFNTTGYVITGNTLTLAGTTPSITTGIGVSAKISSVLAGTTAWSKAGSGTVILTGANTFANTLTISAGVLNIQNGAALGSTAGGTTVSTGAALQLQGGITVTGETLTLSAPNTGVSNDGALRNVSGNNTWTGAITLGSTAGVYRINSDSGLLTLSGVISDSGATNGKNLTIGGAGDTTISSGIQGSSSDIILTKDGSGTLTLTAVNIYDGGTVLNAGTIKLSGAGQLASAAVTVNGGTLDYGSVNDSVGAITLKGGTITSTTGVLTGTSYAVQSGTISAILGGTGAMTKSTAGTVTLTRANTFTGLITVSAGVLNIQNNTALGGSASGVSVTSGAALEIQDDITVGGEAITLNGTGISSGGALRNVSGNNSMAGAITLGSATKIASDTAANTLTLSGGITGAFGLTFDGAGDTTISGVIGTGTGTLTKNGTGTLTLSKANTYTGATTISAGTLQIGLANALSSSTAVTVDSGATLDLNAFSDAIGSLAGSGNVTLGGATLTAGGNNSSTTFSGVISEAGGLVKTGTGTLTLSGNNTYTGGTTLSTGTISFATGALGTAGAVTMDGGTLQWNGANTEDISARLAMVAAKTAVFDTNGNDVTFSSDIGGGTTGALTKTGAGTLTLSGNNTYTGATTVSAGVLKIQNNNALGTSAGGVTVASGAALQLESAGIIVTGETLALAGTGIGASNDGALRNISGNNSFTGTITIQDLPATTRINSDAGTLTLGAIGETGNAAKTLSFGGAGNITVNGVISGANDDLILAKDGSGTLTLTGANTYTASTTISAGALNIRHATALGTTAGGVTVASGAVLEIQGGIAVGAEAITLNGTGISSGGALRNISSNNSMSGAITLGSASEIASDSGTLTLTGAIGGAAQNLTVDGAGNVTLSGVIGTTTGTLTKNGEGTLTLSGIAANTFTGLTTVNTGRLTLNKTAGINAIAGGVAITGGTLALGAANQIATTAVTVSGGVFDIATFSDTVGVVTLTSGSITGTTGALTGTSYATNSGAISANLGANTATLTQSTAGTTTLSGNNAYTGATTISGGTLVVTTLANGGVSSSIGAAGTAGTNLVIDGGTLSYAGSTAASTNRLLQIGGTIAGGAGTISNDAISAANTVTFVGPGAVAYGTSNQNRTFTLTGSNTGDNTFALSLGDNGTGKTAFIKNGVGKWILSATSGLTGATAVNAGTLVVNGSITGSATTVSSGATLAGSGSVGALTLNSGGFLTPGTTGNGTIGTLSAASLTWNGGGVMQFDLGLPNATDLVALSGALTKSGAGSYTFDFLGTGSHGGVYTLITAGSIAGFTAANFSYTNMSVGNTGTFSIVGNNIVLTVVPEPQEYALGLAGGAALLAGLKRRKRAVK